MKVVEEGKEASGLYNQAKVIRDAALGIGARYLVPRKARHFSEHRGEKGNAQTIIIR